MEFPPVKLRWRKHIEMTSIFCPWKLCRAKHVETTSNFCLFKLYWKSSSKLRGIFFHIFLSTYRCNINIGSMSIRRVVFVRSWAMHSSSSSYLTRAVWITKAQKLRQTCLEKFLKRDFLSTSDTRYRSDIKVYQVSDKAEDKNCYFSIM